MAISDPIADMLTRIRNANMVGHKSSVCGLFPYCGRHYCFDCGFRPAKTAPETYQ